MRERERLKSKIIPSEESIVKESQHHNVSVLINHHQDFRKDDIECYLINNQIQKQGRKLYIHRKKVYTTIQSMNQRSYLKNITEI